MSELNEKRGRGRPRKIDSDEYNDIEDLLAELSGNYKCMLDRIEPEYCSGFIGKFYVGQGSGISLEEIRRRWGGRVFKLRIFDEAGKLAKQRTISIDEEPKREGKPINPDGTTQRENMPVQQHPAQNQNDMFSQIINSNLPDQLKQMYLAHMSGYPFLGAVHPQQKEPEKEIHFYQLLNDMMKSNRENQTAMAKAQLELMDSIFEMKRKNNAAAAPADPISQLNQTIELVRAMNGVRGELQPQQEESIASQLIGSSLPMLENAFTEFMAYKKAAVQAQLQRSISEQNNRPPITPRIPADDSTPQIAATGESINPLSKAREMAAMFKNLPPNEQASAMSEFFSALENDGNNSKYDQNRNENVERDQNFDTMENIDTLPIEDRAILESLGANGNQIETGHVQNGNGTGTIEDHHKTDRPGNQKRIDFSPH